MWRSASFSRLAIVPKSSAGSLTIVSIASRDRAMAVSNETRRASSIALCRVGECATPLRSGRVGTKGIGIVEADESAAGLRIVVQLQRYFDAVTIHDRFVETLLDEVPVRRILILIDHRAQRSDYELFDR